MAKRNKVETHQNRAAEVPRNELRSDRRAKMMKVECLHTQTLQVVVPEVSLLGSGKGTSLVTVR